MEGWELNVLKGSKNLLESDKAPILCVEYNTTQPMDGGSTMDLYRYILSVNNYRIFKLLKGKQHPSALIPVESEEFLPENDNLFCFLPHHINKLPFDMFG